MSDASEPMTEPSGRRVIKRYSNRKLYDTKDSRYVTLLEIAEYVRAGEDVQVIDNATKEDKTDVTLLDHAFLHSNSAKSVAHLYVAEKTAFGLRRAKNTNPLYHAHVKSSILGRALFGNDRETSCDE